MHTPLSDTSAALVQQVFKTGDSIRVRATRSTCSARWNGKTGYITGAVSLTSAWDIAYEVALDTGGMVWLTEAALMPRRKVR